MFVCFLKAEALRASKKGQMTANILQILPVITFLRAPESENKISFFSRFDFFKISFFSRFDFFQDFIHFYSKLKTFLKNIS
jgi:hypothetical protein